VAGFLCTVLLCHVVNFCSLLIDNQLGYVWLYEVCLIYGYRHVLECTVHMYCMVKNQCSEVTEISRQFELNLSAHLQQWKT